LFGRDATELMAQDESSLDWGEGGEGGVGGEVLRVGTPVDSKR